VVLYALHTIKADIRRGRRVSGAHDVVGATRWLKLRAMVRKGSDAKTVTEGLIFPEGGKIKEMCVELSLELIYFFKNQPACRPLDTGGST